MFDSSGGFLLPDGSVRSPDASLVLVERWEALSEAERISEAMGLDAGPVFPGLAIDLKEIGVA